MKRFKLLSIGLIGLAVGFAYHPSHLHAQYYVRAENVWLSQDSSDFDFGRIGSTPISADTPDSYEAGIRLQVGKGLSGGGALEAVYLGANHWSDSQVVNGGGSIVSDFSASGHGDSNVSTVLGRSSDFHSGQLNYRYESEISRLFSSEILIGARYAYYEDTLDLSATSSFGKDTTNVETSNNLIAFQLGFERNVQHGKFSIDSYAIGGIGSSMSRATMNFRDLGHGSGTFNGSDNGSNFVSFIDAGLAGRYALTNNLTLRTGYFVQVYSDIANAADTLTANNSRIGLGGRYTSIDADNFDNLVLHGGFVGLEFVLP